MSVPTDQHFVLTGIPSGDHLRPTDTFTVAVTAAAADGRDVTGDGYHGNGGFAGDATANVICNGSFALASSKPAVANVTGQHCMALGTPPPPQHTHTHTERDPRERDPRERDPRERDPREPPGAARRDRLGR